MGASGDTFEELLFSYVCSHFALDGLSTVTFPTAIDRKHFISFPGGRILGVALISVTMVTSSGLIKALSFLGVVVGLVGVFFKQNNKKVKQIWCLQHLSMHGASCTDLPLRGRGSEQLSSENIFEASEIY